MNNISKPTAKNKQNNPLRLARAEAFYKHLSSYRDVHLDDSFYELSKHEGFSRAQIDLAVNDLVKRGLAVIEHQRLMVIVKLNYEESDEVVV
jgi:hypothetical protein